MIPKVVQFLKDNNLTLNQISRASDISPSTLSNTFKRPAESWKGKIFVKLASVSNTSIGKISEYFLSKPNNKWHLKIDDKKHTIQNVHIEDKKAFRIIKSTITVECMEGWKPSKADVESVVNHYYHPLPEIDKVLNQMRNKYGKGE